MNDFIFDNLLDALEQKHIAKKIIDQLKLLCDIKNLSDSFTIMKKIINNYGITRQLTISIPNKIIYFLPSELRIFNKDTNYFRMKQIPKTKNLRIQHVKNLDEYFTMNSLFFKILTMQKISGKKISFNKQVLKIALLDKKYFQMIPIIYSEFYVLPNFFQDTDVYYMASKLAKYYDFLFEKYVDAYILHIKYVNDTHKFGMLFYTFEQMKNSKVKTIKKINFFDMLKFIDVYQGNDFKFFSHLKNLENIEFEFLTYNIGSLRIESVQKVIPIFEDIKKIKICNIILNGSQCHYILPYLNETIKIASDIGLKVKLKDGLLYHNTFISEGVFPSYTIPVDHIIFYKVRLHNVTQCKYLLPSIQRLTKLETLDIIIYSNQYSDFLNINLSQNELIYNFNIIFYFKKIINIPLFKYLSLRITNPFIGSEYLKRSEEAENNLTYYFIRIIPSSLIFLSLNSVQNFTKKMAYVIGKRAPQLEYLYLSVKNTLYRKCLLNFPMLKYFAFESYFEVEIPNTVEVVVYLPPFTIEYQENINFSNKFDNTLPSDCVNVISYLKNLFNHCYTYFYNKNLTYFIFFNNFDYWKNHQKLFMFATLKYDNVHYQ
ncbi:Hypothetical protein SRAE_X000041800 [Strongyloides ratti]|uniref:Uncharacterized protein n=1 Tax=Strongyloides ratti TaxID=34506 RepID=A0A090LMW9_STRRB|nr:Hypothetical protein SRAE_X000041800 [Strongyloides ratti]CEF71091.1 Hypothetical protein SRAE_X000041800 [Strongyloides ratti]